MSIRSDDTCQCGPECEATIVHPGEVSRALSHLPADTDIANIAAVFDALGDVTRVRIALALLHVELCVCDLAAVVGISQSGVSHQLRILRDLRIVSYRRDGKRAVYRLIDDHVREVLMLGLAHTLESQER